MYTTVCCLLCIWHHCVCGFITYLASSRIWLHYVFGFIVYLASLCIWLHCVFGFIAYLASLRIWLHCIFGFIDTTWRCLEINKIQIQHFVSDFSLQNSLLCEVREWIPPDSNRQGAEIQTRWRIYAQKRNRWPIHETVEKMEINICDAVDTL